jgi:crotonobetainyl-CoA:carnitine CoA-transferase CaiB-like acyl-CoA transferase
MSRDEISQGSRSKGEMSRNEVSGSWPSSPAPAGILAGVRVWDASWVGVGPLTAKYLADYGATVVHTETAARPDVLRNGPPFRDGIPGLNRSQFFADFNSSKYGLGLDLKHPRGRDVALRLAGWADVVLESFSPGVMGQFGLGYEALAAVNPSVIMLSTSMNGQTGPRRKFAGFGTVMAAMAGFCELTGWPDRPPGSPYGAYTDFVSPRFAATALLAALDHRRRTGQGQYVDLAQYEASVQLHAPWLLDFAVNGQVVTRAGNRSPAAAPHGIYRCLDEGGRERWVAIAVEDDAMWAAFVAALGSPPWALEPRFATRRGRKDHEDDLDALVGAWTAERRSTEVFYLLQPDVAAAPVHDARDLQQDPQIRFRQYFRELDHTVMGPTLYEGRQAELSATPPVLSKAAPCLGEDSRLVLAELLGLGAAEIDELISLGVVEQFEPEAP